MILAGGHAGDDGPGALPPEAEAVARLQHPHIVQIYEVGEHDGRPFFSLEFCPGGSLDKQAQRHAAAAAGSGAAGGDAGAGDAGGPSSKGVIHRDLKPANVLLTEDGTPKITDFGLAKKLDDGGPDADRARSWARRATWRRSRRAARRKEIGPAADVYALGAILYECLTGRPPFKAATALDTLMQVLVG